MNSSSISRKLLRWYEEHARALPWRETRDPYRIWVSEVMLQQTRVDTVIPYYRNWLTVFPDLESLAAADDDTVMRAWEGLGYYGRARNLRKAARILVNDYSGRFPVGIAQLKKLPGIGEYIAGALASIALGQDEIALDGNGLRILARLYEFQAAINEAAGKAELGQLMRSLLPKGEAGQFNQAVMDLGSLICIPKNPLCSQCPLQQECLAFQHGSQMSFPCRSQKKPLPHYDVVAAVIRRGNKVLIDKRRSTGLLGGLWEFPGGKVEPGESLHEALVREIKEELGVEFSVENELGKYKHAYTHFKVTVFVFSGNITDGEPAGLEAEEIQWVEIGALGKYPMGKIDRLISLSLTK